MGLKMTPASLSEAERELAAGMVRRHLALIRSLARKLSQRLGIDADDLEQEGRLAVIAAISSYDSSRGAETTWVWMRARNGMLNAAQAARRRAEELTGDADERAGACESSETSPEDALASAELVQLLDKTLSQRDVLIVVNCIIGEKPAAELARELGVGRSAVTMRMSKTKASLQELMQSAGFIS